VSLQKYLLVIENESKGIPKYLKQKTAGLNTGILAKFLKRVLLATNTRSGLPNKARLVRAL
jgi:hypothetical protein